MATRVIHVDDIDGTEADVTTVEFALEGVQYTIDLSDKNAEKLRKALAVYIEHAQRVGGRARPPRTGGTPARTDREQLQAIRDWAKRNDYTVNNRGRIPAEVREAFEVAHR